MKHSEINCIQKSNILLINKDTKMINDKLDALIEDRKEQKKLRDEFELRIFQKFDELDDKFVSKKLAVIILKTIWISATVVVAIWNILTWFSNLK